MIKILFSTLLAIIFSTNQASAEDINKTTEELIVEFMKLDQKIEEEKKKQAEARAKTATLKKKSEDIRKLGKTVDELAKKLGIND